jgi:acyl carrier protein phosphodiesterase
MANLCPVCDDVVFEGKLAGHMKRVHPDTPLPSIAEVAIQYAEKVNGS